MDLNPQISNNGQIERQLAQLKHAREVHTISLDSLPERPFLSIEQAYVEYADYTKSLNERNQFAPDFDLITLNVFSTWWEKATPALKFFAEALWASKSFQCVYPMLKHLIDRCGWQALSNDLKVYATAEGMKSYRMEEACSSGLQSIVLCWPFGSETHEDWCRETSAEVVLSALKSWGRGLEGDRRYFQRREERSRR